MNDARRAAGLDQKVVAKAIGISQSTLSELEREAKGSSHVVAFAKMYGVNAHWLATGEGESRDDEKLSAEALAIARAYEKLNPSERHRLRLLMLAARDGVNPDNITSPTGDATKPQTPLDIDSGLGDLGPDTARQRRRG